MPTRFGGRFSGGEPRLHWTRRSRSTSSDWRKVLVELEDLRAARNTAGRAIGKAKDNDERQRLIAAQRDSAARIDELEDQLREFDPR